MMYNLTYEQKEFLKVTIPNELYRKYNEMSRVGPSNVTPGWLDWVCEKNNYNIQERQLLKELRHEYVMWKKWINIHHKII